MNQIIILVIIVLAPNYSFLIFLLIINLYSFKLKQSFVFLNYCIFLLKFHTTFITLLYASNFNQKLSLNYLYLLESLFFLIHINRFTIKIIPN